MVKVNRCHWRSEESGMFNIFFLQYTNTDYVVIIFLTFFLIKVTGTKYNLIYDFYILFY